MKRYRLTRLGKIVVFSFAALLILVSLTVYNLLVSDVGTLASPDTQKTLPESGVSETKPGEGEPNTTSNLIVYAADQLPVNPNNCEEVMKLKASIFFQPDSKVLESEYGELLNMFAQVASVVAVDYKIKVEGNCATVYQNPKQELEQYYGGLSMSRAAKVADILKEKGVAVERIIAVGNGSTKPGKSNNTPEGRAYNRRVDIYFIEPTQKE